MRVEHRIDIRESHTPDSRYGACSCGWEAPDTRYGPLARSWACSDAEDHLRHAALLSREQATHARRQAARRATAALAARGVGA